MLQQEGLSEQKEHPTPPVKPPPKLKNPAGPLLETSIAPEAEPLSS